MTSERRGDLILAPATPPGPAPRAVLRLSGPGLLAAAGAFLPVGLPCPSGAREVLAGRWPVAEGLGFAVELLAFPGPGSATGEDVLEIHLPSGAAAMEQVRGFLLAAGFRAAEPGEFTRRAFLHGRLDLVQAEAVLDLVHARSAAEARAASNRLQGSLGPALQSARDALVAALVELEAGLDFEEGDSQDLQPGEIEEVLAAGRKALEAGLARERQRRQRRGEDWRILLLGPANAGKTTLFQELTGTAGLVSSVAGTTRDRREARWQRRLAVDQAAWTLLDLPGLGGRAVDARDEAARALATGQLTGEAAPDLALMVLPSDADPAALDLLLPECPLILVWSQGDRGLPVAAALREVVARRLPEPAATVIVGDHGRAGRDALELAVAAALEELAGHGAVAARHSRRHQEALEGALAHLRLAQEWVVSGGPQDLVAEELRQALAELAALVGEVTPEDLLDRVFGAFCIGK